MVTLRRPLYRRALQDMGHSISMYQGRRAPPIWTDGDSSIQPRPSVGASRMRRSRNRPLEPRRSFRCWCSFREGKPDTFDFLGVTHISGKDRNGNLPVKRHTIGKRMRGKSAEIKQQLRQRMTTRWLKPGSDSSRSCKASSTITRYQATPVNLLAYWRNGGYQFRGSYILIPQFALTPFIQDKSLMR